MALAKPTARCETPSNLAPPTGCDVLVLAEIVENGIDGDLAGQFSGLLSAHAVADHENSVAQVVAEIVLVVLAHEADVGIAGGLDQQSSWWKCKR